jgi:hypothetical protein
MVAGGQAVNLCSLKVRLTPEEFGGVQGAIYLLQEFSVDPMQVGRPGCSLGDIRRPARSRFLCSSPWAFRESLLYYYCISIKHDMGDRTINHNSARWPLYALRHIVLAKEGIRIRWYGRASNPVGDVSRSQVGSTPAAFRPFEH